MSNGVTAMYDAIDRYLALCSHFNEEPVYDIPDTVEQTLLGGCLPDCYGEHSDSLERRRKEEVSADDNHYEGACY